MYYGLDFYLPLSCACVRARVCVRVSMCECFFVCMFCMPCVEWVWMFFVLLFYVIYSRTIASIANVFCWLYPTLNKVYLIYLILSYLYEPEVNRCPCRRSVSPMSRRSHCLNLIPVWLFLGILHPQWATRATIWTSCKATFIWAFWVPS